MKATVAFAVFVVGCGSVTQSSLLPGEPQKDAEVVEVAAESVGEVVHDGGDALLEAGRLDAGSGTDGPFGGKHTIDIPAYVNDEPPMLGRWNINLGTLCSGTMDITITPDGHGWTLGGTWACSVTKGNVLAGDVSGAHDWNTDVVDLTLEGMGGGTTSGTVRLTDGGSGSMTVTGTLKRDVDSLTFVAIHR